MHRWQKWMRLRRESSGDKTRNAKTSAEAGLAEKGAGGLTPQRFGYNPTPGVQPVQGRGARVENLSAAALLAPDAGFPLGGPPSTLPHIRATRPAASGAADRVPALDQSGTPQTGGKGDDSRACRRGRDRDSSSPCGSPHDSPRSFPPGCDTDPDPDRLLTGRSCVGGGGSSVSTTNSTTTDTTRHSEDRSAGGSGSGVAGVHEGAVDDAENHLSGMPTRRPPTESACPPGSGAPGDLAQGLQGQPGIYPSSSSAAATAHPHLTPAHSLAVMPPHTSNMYGARALFVSYSERERDTERRLQEALRSPLGGPRPVHGAVALPWGSPPTPPLAAAAPPPPPSPAASPLPSPGAASAAAGFHSGCEQVAGLRHQPLAGMATDPLPADDRAWGRLTDVGMALAGHGAAGGAISARDLLVGRAPRTQPRPSHHQHLLHNQQQRQQQILQHHPQHHPQQQQQPQQRQPQRTPCSSQSDSHPVTPTKSTRTTSDTAAAAAASSCVHHHEPAPAPAAAPSTPPAAQAGSGQMPPPARPAAEGAASPATAGPSEAGVTASSSTPACSSLQPATAAAVCDLEPAYSGAPSLSHMLGADQPAGSSGEISPVSPAPPPWVSGLERQQRLSTGGVHQRQPHTGATVLPSAPGGLKTPPETAMCARRESSGVGSTEDAAGCAAAGDAAEAPRLSVARISSLARRSSPPLATLFAPDADPTPARGPAEGTPKPESPRRSEGRVPGAASARDDDGEAAGPGAYGKAGSREEDFTEEELRSFFWRPKRRRRSRRLSQRLPDTSSGDVAEDDDGQLGWSARGPEGTGCSGRRPASGTLRLGRRDSSAREEVADARANAKAAAPVGQAPNSGCCPAAPSSGSGEGPSRAGRRRSLQKDATSCPTAAGGGLACQGDRELHGAFGLAAPPACALGSPGAAAGASIAPEEATATAVAAVCGSTPAGASGGAGAGGALEGGNMGSSSSSSSRGGGSGIISHASAPVFLRTSCGKGVSQGGCHPLPPPPPPLRAVETLLACLSGQQEDQEVEVAQVTPPHTGDPSTAPAGDALPLTAAAPAAPAGAHSREGERLAAPPLLVGPVSRGHGALLPTGAACTAALDESRLAALRAQWRHMCAAAAANRLGALALSSGGRGGASSCSGAGAGGGGDGGRSSGGSLRSAGGAGATAGVAAALAGDCLAGVRTAEAAAAPRGRATWACIEMPTPFAAGGSAATAAAGASGAGGLPGVQWRRNTMACHDQAQVTQAAQAMQAQIWPASGAAEMEGPLARCVAERLMTKNPLFRGKDDGGQSSLTDEAETSREEAEFEYPVAEGGRKGMV